jgi:hypothetical protein
MAGQHRCDDDPMDDGVGEVMGGGNPPRAEVLADADRPGGFMLLLDRVRQSYVDLDDPGYLEFEYVRWMAHGLDSLPPGPLAVTHLGGGAGTLVRYLSATRPGSTHIVCEPDEEVTALVRSRLPFDRKVRVRVRPLDGRTGLAGLGAASADVVVLDAFSGGRVPADLTTRECAAQVARVLRASGVLLVNVGDGSGLGYTRRLAAGVLGELPHGLLVTDKAVLHGRRYGNVVLMASAAPLPVDEIRRGLAAEPFPCVSLAGRHLTRWLGGAGPFTDADSARSPAPPEATWRVARD